MAIWGLTIIHVVTCMLWLWSLWYIWQQRRQAGAILLDLRFSMRAWQVLLAVAFGVVTVVTGVYGFVIDVFENGITLQNLGQFASFTPMGGFCLVLATSRNQICEHGLLTRGFLLRWEEVRGYEWRPDRPNTLRLYKPGLSVPVLFHSVFSSSDLYVPSKHRARVIGLLTHYTSGTASH